VKRFEGSVERGRERDACESSARRREVFRHTSQDPSAYPTLLQSECQSLRLAPRSLIDDQYALAPYHSCRLELSFPGDIRVEQK